MTLTTILLFFCGLAVYWITKVMNAKQKHKSNFRVGTFLLNNKWQIVISIFGGVVAYYTLPQILPSATTDSVAAISGYAGSSLLKFIVDSLKLSFAPKKS